MRAWMSAGDLRDQVIETVAVKSGILLTEHDVYRLLGKSELSSFRKMLTPGWETFVGVRPEFYEDLILVLRTAIGNLPDASKGEFVAFRVLSKHPDLLPRAEEIIDYLAGLSLGLPDELTKGRSLFPRAKKRFGLSSSSLKAFLEVVDIIRDRSADIDARSTAWDGVVSLSKLFRQEAIPSDPERYLDQRFIDYLAAKGEDTHEIHWRNFERLCAEYFRRHDYRVSLGPGRSDGGVDIRVWPKGKSKVGPPLMLIQCKRLAKKSTVDIEVVKAFWTDVAYERAKYGLIATTGRVAKGGKTVAKARQYPLKFAEGAEVKEWVQKLWRYPWKGKARSEGIGNYPLAPILPIGQAGIELQEKWGSASLKALKRALRSKK